MKKKNSLGNNSAFTLVELLTVIAIIGILAGILIPTVGAVKASAYKAKTKAQFSQWGTAFTAFKQEYGYYPPISGKINSGGTGAVFIAELTGKTYEGKETSTTYNKKKLSFYSLSDTDLLRDYNSSGVMDVVTPPQIVDAFGNTDIAIYVDTNGNGVVDGNDGGGEFSDVSPIDNTSAKATPSMPTGGVRAAVAFYSAGKGGKNDSEVSKNLVKSWE